MSQVPPDDNDAPKEEQISDAEAPAEGALVVPIHGMIYQCDPGLKDYRVYTFTQGSLVANMLVARVRKPNVFEVGTEYWYMNVVPSATASTTVEMADYYWSTTPNPPITLPMSFTMVQDATWTIAPPSLAQGPLQVNAVTPNIGIQWKLTRTSGVWNGSIIWSRTTPRAGVDPNSLFAGSPSTQVFTDSSTVPSTLTYNANVPVRQL
jgi:hypothetical protein